MALVLVAACSSSSAHPVALATRSPVASPSAAASPSASTSATPVASSPSPSPTSAPSDQGPQCTPAQHVPAYGPSAASNRSLAIVRLSGSNGLVVRDVTDINNPTTVASLDIPDSGPRFINASEVAWEWSDAHTNLFRTRIGSGSNTVVASCTPTFYDWSPDGTTLTYVSWDGKVSQLRQLKAGVDSALTSLPALPQGVGCESDSCADTWQFEVSYSPDGRYVFVAETPFNSLRIYSSAGNVVFAPNSQGVTRAVWSGAGLYFQDSAGIEVWQAGSVSTVLKGVAWIAPIGSPAGGSILFTIRDASGLPRVRLLDTATGTVRDLASAADRPHFLTARYVWYRGMRLCSSTDTCPLGPVTPTGKTYIYDLQTGVSVESRITDVIDTWPHAA